MYRFLRFTIVFLCFLSGHVLTAPADASVAASNCQLTQVTQCAQPMMMYVMQESRNLNKDSLSQTQFRELCTRAKSAVTCIDAWVNRCASNVSSDVKTILHGTGQFLHVCDEPQAYQNISRFSICGKKMASANVTCHETHKNLPSRFNPQQPASILNDRKLLTDLCCQIRRTAPCYIPKVQSICGSEDRRFFESMTNRLYDVYKCSSTFANCQSGQA